MAHMVETMAYAGEVPWHGLGVPVSNDLTPQQMLDKAGLNWNVDELPNYVNWNGEKKYTGMKTLVRSSDGKVLTSVGKNWHPVQNETAFEFFNEFVAAGEMEMHTAGSLKDGQMVWALAKIKDGFELSGGDVIESYLLFSNPHEFGKCIDIRTTNVRVVCNNTLTFSLKEKSENVVRRSHRTQFDATEVKEALGVAKEKMNTYKETAQFLSKKRAKDEDVVDYFKRVFPVITTKGPDAKKDISKSAELALQALHEQPGANMSEGSWWQAYNAVTFLTNHKIGRNNDNRIHSAWYGANKRLNVRALETAVEFANVS